MENIQTKVNIIVATFIQLYKENEHKDPDIGLIDHIKTKAVLHVLSEQKLDLQKFQEESLKKMPSYIDHNTIVNGILEGFIKAFIAENGSLPSEAEIIRVKKEIEDDLAKIGK